MGNSTSTRRTGDDGGGKTSKRRQQQQHAPEPQPISVEVPNCFRLCGQRDSDILTGLADLAGCQPDGVKQPHPIRAILIALRFAEKRGAAVCVKCAQKVDMLTLCAHDAEVAIDWEDARCRLASRRATDQITTRMIQAMRTEREHNRDLDSDDAQIEWGVRSDLHPVWGDAGELMPKAVYEVLRDKGVLVLRAVDVATFNSTPSILSRHVQTWMRRRFRIDALVDDSLTLLPLTIAGDREVRTSDSLEDVVPESQSSAQSLTPPPQPSATAKVTTKRGASGVIGRSLFQRASTDDGGRLPSLVVPGRGARFSGARRVPLADESQPLAPMDRRSTKGPPPSLASEHQQLPITRQSTVAAAAATSAKATYGNGFKEFNFEPLASAARKDKIGGGGAEAGAGAGRTPRSVTVKAVPTKTRSFSPPGHSAFHARRPSMGVGVLKRAVSRDSRSKSTTPKSRRESDPIAPPPPHPSPAESISTRRESLRQLSAVAADEGGAEGVGAAAPRNDRVRFANQHVFDTWRRSAPHASDDEELRDMRIAELSQDIRQLEQRQITISELSSRKSGEMECIEESLDEIREDIETKSQELQQLRSAFGLGRNDSDGGMDDVTAAMAAYSDDDDDDDERDQRQPRSAQWSQVDLCTDDDDELRLRDGAHRASSPELFSGNDDYEDADFE